MGVIADLVVKVGADIADVHKKLGEVNTDVQEAGSGFGKLGALATGGALAVVGAVTAMAAFGLHAVEQATEAGQAAFEMSEKFGLTGQQASAYLSVGKQLGLTNEQISKGFQFLSKNVSAMAITVEAGGKISATQGQVYKDLGINVFDAGHHIKTANELMLEAADAFKGMADGPEKAALSMKLFGKSGTDLLPVLNQGRAGIESMMQAGQQMGDVMSTSQVEAAHKLALEHKQLDTAMEGVTLQIGNFLMPIMVQIMGFVVSTAIPAIQRFGSYFMEHLWPAIQQIYAGFMQLIGPALKYISENFDSIKPVLIGLAIVFGLMAAAAVIAVGLVVVAVIGIVAGVVWVATQVKAHWNDVVGFIHGLPGRISAAASGMWDGLWATFRAVLNRIIGAWNGLHFTTPSGDFLGQHIPSATLRVPAIPYLHGGGTVPGLPGQNVLAMLQAGEEVTAAGGGREIHNHYHVDSGAYIDGPSLDILANKLAQRMRFASGI